jgi:hypothetical protein
MASKSDKNKERLEELQTSLRKAYLTRGKFPKDYLQEALKLAYKNTGDFYADDHEPDDESDLARSITKEIFKVCVSCAENLLPVIVFVNDVLKVPPTKTFLDIYRRVCIRDSAKFKSQKHSPEFQKYRDNIIKGENIIKDEKTQKIIAQKIGAFWGFIFQNVLPYERYPKSVRIGTLGVKTASRFELQDIDKIKNAESLEIVEKLNLKLDMMEGEETK